MCWLFYMNLHFIKHTTDVLFLLRDRKVSISMLLQKVCLGWEFSPIINRWGAGIRMSWVEKKITQEVAFRHLSVRILSIIFQLSFGSAEFGKRFMQCAKKNIFIKKFQPITQHFIIPKASCW